MFNTQCLEQGAMSSYDIKVSKEDQTYRAALYNASNDVIEEFNHMIDKIIPGILKRQFVSNDGKYIIDVKDVEIKFPQFTQDSMSYINTPFIARMTGNSYMCDVYIHYLSYDKTISLNIKNEYLKTNLMQRKLGSFHCVIGSNRDITTICPDDISFKDEWKMILSECPASQGAYIINKGGGEKVVIFNEKLRTNTFITFMTKGDNPTLQTHITTYHNSITSVVSVKIGKYRPTVKVVLPFLKLKHIPLYVAIFLLYDYFKATHFSVGLEFDSLKSVIASFAKNEYKDRIIAYLSPSEKKFLELYNIHGDKIDSYVRKKLIPDKDTSKQESIHKLLFDELFSSVDSVQGKVINLCYVTCQTILCAIGIRDFDSRDKWGMKKVGTLVELISKYTSSLLVSNIKSNKCDDDGFNFGRGEKKDTIVEARKVETLNSTIAERDKVTNHVDVRTNSVTLRGIAGDSVLAVCPAKTPEGETCGLNKVKAALTHTSYDQQYSLNRLLCIDDLFKNVIQLFSLTRTPEFKYRLCTTYFDERQRKCTNFLNWSYSSSNEMSVDGLYISTRYISIFNDLYDIEHAYYYVDESDSVIYINFLSPIRNSGGHQIKVDGKEIKLFTVVPETHISKYINSIKSIETKKYSCITKTEECKYILGFDYNGLISYLSSEEIPIYLSQDSIGRIVKDYKYEVTEGGCATIKCDSVVEFSCTHWSGVEVKANVPQKLHTRIKQLLYAINDFMSIEKFKGYKYSFTINGNVKHVNYTFTSVVKDMETGLDKLTKCNSFIPRVVWCKGPELEKYLRSKKRSGELPFDSCINIDTINMVVQYYDDPGRFLSPLLIVGENGNLVIDEINGWEEFNNYEYNKAKQRIKNLYKQGAIELVDMKEMDSTIIAGDINECRIIGRLRDLLNSLNITDLESVFYKSIMDGFYKCEDVNSIKFNDKKYEVEFTKNAPALPCYTYEHNEETYYGCYFIEKKVYTPYTKLYHKLIKPTNGLIKNTFYMCYERDGVINFITYDDIDLITDGENVFFEQPLDEDIKCRIHYIKFPKDKDFLFVNTKMDIINVVEFTRSAGSNNIVRVFNNEIIDTNDDFIEYKGKFHVLDEYIFPEDETTCVFISEMIKYHRYIPEGTDVDVFNITQAYDEREAKLYMSFVRRYIDEITEIFSGDNVLENIREIIPQFKSKRVLKLLKEYLNGEFKFTHCMIDPNSAYSVIANFVPKADSNPGPRFSYQCSMSTQALGVNNSVYYRRYETSHKRLIAPCEHSFETVAELPLQQISMPITQNFAILVAANYKGFEDPIILSESSLRKYGRYEKESVIKIIQTHSDVYSEYIEFPRDDQGNPKTNPKFRNLDRRGLPRLGTYIKYGDCVIGKTKLYKDKSRRVDSSYIASVSEEGVVTSIQIVGSEGNVSAYSTIYIKLSQRRKQQPGDKIASRYSQKGTIADIIGGMINDGDERLKIIDDCLMPFVVGGPNHGQRADIIFNPASFPSRMTVGLIKEILCSKAALYIQEKVDATNFHKLDIEYYQNALCENKITDEVFYDGQTIIKPNELNFPLKGKYVIADQGNYIIVTEEQLREINEEGDEILPELHKVVFSINGVEKIIDYTPKQNMDVNGSEFMCHSDGEIIMDSTTGKPMKFFFGIVAYQFLKHHVEDKQTARDSGLCKPITHQPNEGRDKNGGQRLGEMERDAILSSGASGVLYDRFMKASDEYIDVYCSHCNNNSSLSNLKSKTCSICSKSGTLVTVSEPRIYKVFCHQMNTICLNIKHETKPVNDFELDKSRIAMGEEVI